jgi:superfamily I DNA/RNA helicase
MNYSNYQTNIFDYIKNGEGNAIVQAVAGSGKSTTATAAIEYMQGEVLSLAFGSKAAAHLKHKIQQHGFIHATGSTFHSAGKNALYISKGYHKVNNSKVYFLTDGYTQHDNELRQATNFITKLVGFAKNYAIGVPGVCNIDDLDAWMNVISKQDISLDCDVTYEDAIAIAINVIKDSNRDVKNIDFDDMLYLPLYYDLTCKQYDWVIVDECQDTNVSRKLLVKKFMKETGRALFIGDENQAIFGFTGAECDSMNIIKDTFNCIELPLSVCYRCGTSIIDVAKKYQPHMEAWEGASLGLVTAEKYEDFLKTVEGLNLNGEDGILCRNNAPNVAMAFALIRKGIGCRIEGKEIGKNLITLCNKWKKVKDLNAFTIKLAEYFDKEFERSPKHKLGMLEDKLETMIILIERCQSLGKHDMDSLKNLINSMFTDMDDLAKKPNIVTLSSIHKAKGLEFDRCFILGNDQFIPSKYAISEDQQKQEQNLLYVSVTRAKNHMVFITDVPARRNKEEQ